MKTINQYLLTALLVITVSVFITSCEVQPQAQQAAGKKAVSASDQILIELDDPNGSASTTRNFYFVFDGSGSMDERCAGDKKIKGAKEAVRRFLSKVPEDVNLGLFVFDNSGAREVLPIGSNNRDAFLKSINAVNANGGTPLADAIKTGTNSLVKQYKKQLGYGDFRLVVVTDGDASGIPGAGKYATKRGIPIYSIGLCIGSDHPLRDVSISYKEANNYADLEKALEETVAESPTFDASAFEGL